MNWPKSKTATTNEEFLKEKLSIISEAQCCGRKATTNKYDISTEAIKDWKGKERLMEKSVQLNPEAKYINRKLQRNELQRASRKFIIACFVQLIFRRKQLETPRMKLSTGRKRGKEAPKK